MYKHHYKAALRGRSYMYMLCTFRILFSMNIKLYSHIVTRDAHAQFQSSTTMLFLVIIKTALILTSSGKC